jgi:hypothetical protein
MSETRKEQKPGLFAPSIDRTKCEGGYHHAALVASPARAGGVHLVAFMLSDGYAALVSA